MESSEFSEVSSQDKACSDWQVGDLAKRTTAVAITVFIRYQIDPSKAAAFEAYARRWLTIIPRCGGDLIGYWAPHEGTNNIAFGLISFASLAAYESYRAHLKADPDAVANFNFAQEQHCVLAEERTFLRPMVDGQAPS